jgi:hypothetical protein
MLGRDTISVNNEEPQEDSRHVVRHTTCGSSPNLEEALWREYCFTSAWRVHLGPSSQQKGHLKGCRNPDCSTRGLLDSTD